MVVSHDRAFLERTVTRVLELDEHTARGTEYGGGWLGYLDARATARRHAEEEYATYRAERDRLERAGAHAARSGRCRACARPKKRRPRERQGIRHFRVSASEKQAAKARRTEKAIERLDVVDKPWEGWELRFQSPTRRAAATW